MDVSVNGKRYWVDAQGFLLDLSQWDEDFARFMAAKLSIPQGLTPKHWDVIHSIRDSFFRKGLCPVLYETCRANGLTLADLRALFPTGYLRGACLIAGMTYKGRAKKAGGEPGTTPSGDQSASTPTEKNYRADVAGFLVDPAEWDEEYAAARAAEMKLPGGLSDKHWQIIRFLRQSYDRTGMVPTVYECCGENDLDLDDLEKLFPDGYHRGAVKISGLRVL